MEKTKDMKILGINGSPRGERSGTMRLIRAVLESAREKGAEVEALNLIDNDLKFKNVCSVCFHEGECEFPDDFPTIYEKIKSSDGIVLGSPVYFDLVTGQMKILIDRMSDGIQCQSLAGKYGCAIATSGDHAEQAVVTFQNHFLQMLGATPVGGIEVATGRDRNALTAAEQQARELGKTLADAIATSRKYPEVEQFHQRFRDKFKDIRVNPERPKDYDSWVDETWVW